MKALVENITLMKKKGNRMNISIAGITLRVASSLSVASDESDASYMEFVGDEYVRADNEVINVGIGTDGMPDCRFFRKIFDGGRAWSLHADGEDRIYGTSNISDDGRPLVMARLHNCMRIPSSVTVYCNPGLVVDGAVRNPMGYPLDQIIMMYALAMRGGLIVHAAGMAMGGRAYMFPGVSGAGKSTMTGLFSGRDNGSVLLSDDRIVARKRGGSFSAWGTPWPGEAGVARNANMPLGGIFFLRKGASHNIRELTAFESLKRLMPLASVPWYDRDIVPEYVQVFEGLVSEVPSYEFTFANDMSAVDAFEEFARK
jgi:hypothetical protein